MAGLLKNDNSSAYHAKVTPSKLMSKSNSVTSQPTYAAVLAQREDYSVPSKQSVDFSAVGMRQYSQFAPPSFN